MKARVPQAAAWEDLRAQARSRVARYVSIPPNAFTDQSFMLQQEVPISGKNLSRARAATAEAGAVFEDFRRTQLDLLSRARAAFHRLANEYAQLEVNQRNVDLLNQFAEVNRQRYEVGNASQADVLTAQTDAAKLLEAQSDIFRRISDAQSQLNVLMNRSAQSPLAQPSQIPFQPPHFSLRALQDRKSTRLNSSHLVISYAVFCLKKKKTKFNYLIVVFHTLLFTFSMISRA